MWYGEEMVTDPKTGGRKGKKLARFDLLPPDVLIAIAEHFGRGATKYEDRNWEKGYDWSLSYAAAMRHLAAFWSGEDYDQEFEDSHHLDAAMFHLMALREFFTKGLGTDDRPGGSVNDLARAFREAFGPQKVDPATVEPATSSEQTEGEGWVGSIQARRWEIP
jgi:hypothetical protein